MKLHRPHNSGFTLIELLVVISIIALLAVIIITNVSAARRKAINASKTQLVRQYINAFELYRSNNADGYPDVPAVIVTPGSTYLCLGANNPNLKCYGDAVDQNADLNAQINPYIPGPPASVDPLIAGDVDLRGILYTCNARSSDNKCTQYALQWFIDGTNSTCQIGGATVSIDSGFNTCNYISP